MERRITRITIERTRRLIAVRRIICAYGTRQQNVTVRMVFILNPYDANLDLVGSKVDRKLFQKVCNGLHDVDKFSVKKMEYNDFEKLIGKIFEDVRVMDTLTIPTAWDTNNVNAEAHILPTRTGIVDMFKNNILTKE